MIREPMESEREELERGNTNEPRFHIRYPHIFIGKHGKRCPGSPAIYFGDEKVADSFGHKTEAIKWLRKLRKWYERGIEKGRATAPQEARP